MKKTLRPIVILVVLIGTVQLTSCATYDGSGGSVSVYGSTSGYGGVYGGFGYPYNDYPYYSGYDRGDRIDDRRDNQIERRQDRINRIDRPVTRTISRPSAGMGRPARISGGFRRR